MRLFRHLVAAVLIAGLGTSSARAQSSHVVDPGSLAAVVRQHAEAQDANRSTVLTTLAQPAVQRAAAAAGIDMARVTASVNTMSADDLARTASAARRVDQSLVGGASTVVISTTTIIIGLLVLILLIVALD